MTYSEAMRLEWYWQLIVRYLLILPTMMATRIIGLSLGVFSAWQWWEYLLYPLILSAVMTYWAREAKR